MSVHVGTLGGFTDDGALLSAMRERCLVCEKMFDRDTRGNAPHTWTCENGTCGGKMHVDCAVKHVTESIGSGADDAKCLRCFAVELELRVKNLEEDIRKAREELRDARKELHVAVEDLRKSREEVKQSEKERHQELKRHMKDHHQAQEAHRQERLKYGEERREAEKERREEMRTLQERIDSISVQK